MSASLSGRSAIWSASSAMPAAPTRRGCGGGFDGVRSGTYEMEFEADQVFTAVLSRPALSEVAQMLYERLKPCQLLKIVRHGHGRPKSAFRSFPSSTIEMQRWTLRVAVHKPLRECSALNRARLSPHRNYAVGSLSAMRQMKKLEEQVGAWQHVSVHPHRFGGREFRFGNAELGHVHLGGTVDIPFPRAVRDALLADGLAEQHHWVPNSGWTTSQVPPQTASAHKSRIRYRRFTNSLKVRLA